MWNWGIVYVMAIVTVAMGAVAGMQAYGRKEIAAELEQVQAKLDALTKARRSISLEATTARQQADEHKAAIEEERSKRAVLEAKAVAAVEQIRKLEEQRQAALGQATAADAALHREAKLREEAEDKLKHALEGLAAAKLELESSTSRRRPGLAGVKVPNPSKGEIRSEPEMTGAPAASQGGLAVEGHAAEPPKSAAAVPGSPVGTESDERPEAAESARVSPQDGQVTGVPSGFTQAKSKEPSGGSPMASEGLAAKMGEAPSTKGSEAARPEASDGQAAETSTAGRAVDGEAGKLPESVARVNGANAVSAPSESMNSTETANTSAGPNGEKSAAGAEKKPQVRRSNDDDRTARRLRPRTKPEEARETPRPPTAIFRPY